MGFDVQDKIALVTGSNRGIGKAIVEAFIEAGVRKIYASARDKHFVAPLVERYGELVIPVQLDVSNDHSVHNAAVFADDVDIVVNNAGIARFSTPLSDDIEHEFLEVLNVNTLGLLRVAKAFASALIANNGAFVQLNSIASLRNFLPFSPYCASKAASYSFTQGLREEFMAQGVHVLSVHPGPIDTDMARQAQLPTGPSPETVGQGIVEALKTGQFLYFPDPIAEDFECSYQLFLQEIVLAPPNLG